MIELDYNFKMSNITKLPLDRHYYNGHYIFHIVNIIVQNKILGTESKV
jgi:hypothetical protein